MTLSVGIIGWGGIARVHARHLAAAGARVHGIVSRSATEADGLAVYRHLDEMTPHVGAVTVAVPNHLHAPCCLAAIRAGRAVMVEKPLLIDRRQLADLEPALAAADVPVHLGFRLRYNRSLREFRDRLSGICELRCEFRLGMDQLAAGKDWTRRRAETGGALFTLGVHMHDLARWLARAGPCVLTVVEATATGQQPDCDYPPVATLAARTDGGVLLHAAVDTRGGLDYSIRVEARDAAGSIHVPEPQPGLSDEEPEYGALFADFVRAAETGRVDRQQIAEDLQTHRELLTAREMIEKG